MPIITSTDREEILTVLADNQHVIRLLDNWLEDAYFLEDHNGEKRVHAGLILAQETNTKKYVPYHASAMYGVGSDTAVGILDTEKFVTYDEVGIAPVAHAKVIQAHCYVFGGALGTISGTIKTHLKHIIWV